VFTEFIWSYKVCVANYQTIKKTYNKQNIPEGPTEKCYCKQSDMWESIRVEKNQYCTKSWGLDTSKSLSYLAWAIYQKTASPVALHVA